MASNRVLGSAARVRLPHVAHGPRRPVDREERVIYTLLFRAGADTLPNFGRDPQDRGGTIGVAILHTWSQTLTQHLHVHCLVTGGALARDRSRWIRGRAGCLCPVKALSVVFRAKRLAGLHRAFTDGQLTVAGGGPDRRCGPIRRAARAAPSHAVGRVCEAARWQAGPGAPVPRSSYAPDRDLHRALSVSSTASSSSAGRTTRIEDAPRSWRCASRPPNIRLHPTPPRRSRAAYQPVVKVPAQHRGRRGAPLARRDD